MHDITRRNGFSAGIRMRRCKRNYWNEQYFLRDHKYWAEVEPHA